MAFVNLMAALNSSDNSSGRGADFSVANYFEAFFHAPNTEVLGAASRSFFVNLLMCKFVYAHTLFELAKQRSPRPINAAGDVVPLGL